MSYEAMHRVRASGLTDRTQVDVLEALAFFLNQETGACFPSTESIAKISRVNDRLVRTTLKVLHDLGYVSSKQKSGQKRFFTLHLDRLPEAEPVQKTALLNETTPLHEDEPLYETTPLRESTVHPCRKVQSTPVEKCTSPLYETTPEQVINKEINKEVNKEKTMTRGSRLTLTELPADWKEFAEREEPDLDPERLFEQFRDYWTGLSGSKAVKKDWTATWRNSVRSYHNAEDWKRRPMLRKELASQQTSKPSRFFQEKKQSERHYELW